MNISMGIVATPADNVEPTEMLVREGVPPIMSRFVTYWTSVFLPSLSLMA